MKSLKGGNAVIVGAARSPIGRNRGALRDLHPALLLAQVVTALVERTGIDPGEVDDVVMGCVTQIGDQNSNIARAAWLSAGYPVSVPGTTLNRACGSGQQAVHFAATLIDAGVCDLVVAGGVESMTRVPMGAGRGAGMGKRYPDEMLARYPIPPMGESAEMIAQQWGLSRAYLEELSLRSHQRAASAREAGRFDDEIVPIRLPDGGLFERDECIRAETSMAQLAALKPAFRDDGRVTAGSSSPLSDGAAAVLLASPEKARELGLRPRARVAAQLVLGVDPVIQLTGPIPATREVLRRTGMSLRDIDLFEVNEAFASVLGAWLAELGPDEAKVNVNGGAIALGHPLGSTGARLMTTMLHELERGDRELGLVSMCCGGGFGTATVLARVA